MLLETLSGPLAKALQNGNNAGNAFQGMAPQTADPRTVTNPATGLAPDGVWAAGAGGLVAPNRLMLFPYCDGAAGSQFSVRVYGWRHLGLPSGVQSAGVWVPFFLAELACTACDQPGPPATAPGVSTSLLLDSERLCDTITLTQGVLGQSSPGGGLIQSTGPGTGLTAFAVLELFGAKLFSFDFQPADSSSGIGMNCLWSRA